MSRVESCPWCEGTDWSVKTIKDELRVRCDGCNAAFLPDELEKAVTETGVHA